MSRLVRRIAILLILVFTANVQCWAFNLGNELAHESSENSPFVLQQAGPASQGAHDCGQTGQHCCHALNHLLGQVSGDFALPRVPAAARLFPHEADKAVSVIPENIYRPPLISSLS